jgi:NADH-quinone oxidoreductase subunit G
MSDEVNIEVNGVPMKARKGAMIIHATDAHDVYVPRFCYHDKLPIAANCRMCLVEVEKAPKPMPACATPVMEGMKIFTKSPKALAAQKAVMEFLLINHPLDCPICDQGGECELQDLAMGFGKDASRYAERKRVVKDKNLGPLVSTDMTRCIHCTRCVRFTQDIAGIQELGTIGRGENVEIGTFIEKAVDHELSGNIIDLCPVGALNNKPYRYQARAWEMTQHPLISPHDSVGTNIYAHVLRGRVMRIVPRQNDDINETWIADRDRYSYEGIYSADRQQKPMVREGGEWREVDWQTALQLAAEKLGKIARESAGSESKASQLGVLASANSTLEELHLVARIARDLGSNNLDYRLRQSDFRDQANDPVFPWLGCSINELEQMNSVLIVGSNIRKAAPILAHRVRKAAVAGAKVSFVNPARYEYLFPVAGYLTSNGLGMIDHLAAVLSAACQLTGRAAPAAAANFISATQVSDQQRAVAAQLTQGDKRLVLLGEIAQRDADYSALRSLAAALAEVTGAQLGYLPEGGNAVGASLAGVLPHRTVAGQAAQKTGLNVADMLAARLKAYVLVGAIEPGKDIAAPGASDALKLAECVIALTPYNGAKDYAHIILPIGTFAETSGTYVNLEGRWQSVPGAAKPVGEARPGWKVLRVLGNLLNLTGFEYESAEQVREEIKAQIGDVKPDNRYDSRSTITRSASSERATDVGIYAVDPIVRRATALQQTRDALAAGGQ